MNGVVEVLSDIRQFVFPKFDRATGVVSDVIALDLHIEVQLSDRTKLRDINILHPRYICPTYSTGNLYQPLCTPGVKRVSQETPILVFIRLPRHHTVAVIK